MSKEIRMATWNLNFGLELPEILTTIEKTKDFKGLDFLALQEASIHHGKEDAQAIATLLGDEYSYFQMTAQTQKGYPQANALIWNGKRVTSASTEIFEMPPFHSESRLHKPYKKIFDAEYRVAVVLKTIFQRRISLVTEGEIYGSTFRLYVIHFDLLNLASKTKQMNFVIQDSNRRRHVDTEIIAGDINTFRYFKFPTWSGIQRLAQHEGFVDLTTHIPYTYFDRRHSRRIPPEQKLDAIFVRQSPQLPNRSWGLDVKGSDHIPIFANISLPE